ncbi:MAG: metal ABC transporter substrate-binding protein, partial [Clostridia bacterium]
MKRCLLLFILIGVFLFSGCGAVTDITEETSGLSVVSTTFPGYDLARAVVGDKGKVTMLLAPGEETHSFDPTPADIIAVQESDLFLYVGGESDD